jgi:glycine dehydrogenase subunit 1
MGKRGLINAADQSTQKAHYLHQHLMEKNTRFPFAAPFFKEFVIETPISSEEVVRRMLKKGILAGVPLGRFNKEWDRYLLVAVTEKRTREEIERFVEEISHLD